MLQTLVHSSLALCLSDLILWIYFLLPLNHKGIWFRSYLNVLVVFPIFFNLNLNCATRSSRSELQSAHQSCFCWLYRASPCSAAKNIINVISVLANCVMSMRRAIFCVVGRGCLLWPVNSLEKTLLAFALLHFVLQGQICLLLQVSLDFLLLHSNPLWWKGHLFWC